MGELFLPYAGRVRVSSPYGWRILGGEYSMHYGIDLVGEESKTLLAPCDGTVAVSTMLDRATDPTDTWQWGNYVRIDRANGMRVYLCHMAERLVSAGQTVKRGDRIGIEGNTGYSFGNHCHLEVRVGGAAVDPTPYLGIQNAAGLIVQNAASSSGVPGDGNTPHEWAADAVEWAVRSGILQGDGTSYRLNDPITREEECVMLWRAAHSGSLK